MILLLCCVYRAAVTFKRGADLKGSLLLKCLSNDEHPGCQQMLGEDQRALIKGWFKPSGVRDDGQ